jgi:uncharacterized protein
LSYGGAPDVPLFAGYTATAPDDDAPQSIDSLDAFSKIFGSGRHYLESALRLFFANGGRRALVLSLGKGIAPKLAHYQNALEQLTKLDGQLVAMPDSVLLDATEHAQLVSAVLRVCGETNRWFFIIDLFEGELSFDRVETQNGSYGAAYAPWLVNQKNEKVPPSGAMAGIYASRNVWEAPSNVTPLGINCVAETIGSQTMTSMLQETPRVNPIRAFIDDNRVWGARTLSGDSPEYRYIQIRRMVIYLEQSIKDLLQQFVFEPNDASLWQTVRDLVTSFLTGLWKQSAFTGGKPDEAFFVQCGLRSTMTQDDIDNGRLNVLIGFAPLQPAEFVIIQITQPLAASDGRADTAL